MSEITFGQLLQQWHTWLDDNRGDRARLRRADSPEDILLTDAFFHFLEWMKPLTEWSEKTPLLTKASIAGAVAHVKANKQTASRINLSKKSAEVAVRYASFAEQLATPVDGKSKAPMSELRFQQLQKSTSPEDFYRRVLRAIHLLDCNVNVLSLAYDISHWHREFNQIADYRNPQNRIAVRWATDYFTALPKNTD
jgi:CRISPR system Cascade subunit CasB